MEHCDAAGLGTALWAAALVSLLVAGFSVGFQVDWWRPVTVVATLVSLVVLVLFWNRRLIIGTGIDIGVLVGMVALGWPPRELLGF